LSYFKQKAGTSRDYGFILLPLAACGIY